MDRSSVPLSGSRDEGENVEVFSATIGTIDDGGISSQHSNASSQGSHSSPSLSPNYNHPMTNSIISNLDLGEDDRGEGRSVAAGGMTAATSSSSTPGDENISSTEASTSSLYSQGRATPLAPRDVLRPSNEKAGASSGRTPTIISQSIPHSSSSANTTLGADDSALDALVEAHQKQESHPYSPRSTHDRSRVSDPLMFSPRNHESTSSPSKRDASFGLDPDADTSQSVHGKPFRISSLTRQQSHHHQQHTHVHHSVYDEAEESAPSHTTAATGAPETAKTDAHHSQTVPTVSSTGMPRIWPRRTSHSQSDGDSHHSATSSHAPAPKEMMPNYPPSGSLTLAIFSREITWRRRGYLLIASVAINLGLPFINGVMLGFGEIFARTIVAPWIGLTPAAININAPGTRTTSTSNVGLRYAGVGRTQELDGELVSIERWEVEPGQRGRTRGRQ